MPKDRHHQPTHKTTLLLLSDTHTLTPQDPNHNQNENHPQSQETSSEAPIADPAFLSPLPPADILIHAGDLTKVSRRHEHLTTLSYLKSHPAALKLIVPGNHDITFDEAYYNELGHHRHRNRTDHTAPSARASAANISSGKAEPGQVEDPEAIRRLYTCQEAWEAGIRLLEKEGVYEFEVVVGGAGGGGDGDGYTTTTKEEGKKKKIHFKVYASPWTPEFCQWAFGYERGVDRFNPPDPASASPPTAEQEEQQQQQQQQDDDYAPEIRERTRTHGSTGSRGEGARGTVAANSGRGGFVAPAPIPDEIDLVITHGPPYGILDQVVPNHVSVGCEHLYRAVKRARPRLHVFGHIHEGYGAMRREWSTGNDSLIQCDRQRTREEHCARVDVSKTSMMPLNPGQETLFVNASVVSVQYHPINAPWLVEMELPVAPDADHP
ncbi:uncharacterized protein BP01DRAFT_360402 [Aspergillus saccharolyticus JOP 1030-1]|uniref:Calcineurin-like phosphoesterase domain-containing protein n=1 Tax=Aspergillus saccharolyticus JOP 1030-1 TaxID=1450539 RepID=A0A318ZMM0_9EURO|nr:hypothetical protein BP01DRAFT_360402 [Aspergillus saccharolyticus JOP 1030-1]PYH41428.1 hypothetical protein BP01DRAFT_360402 [Aspergillus saccharolyticus JOP 1030-1]